MHTECTRILRLPVLIHVHVDKSKIAGRRINLYMICIHTGVHVSIWDHVYIYMHGILIKGVLVLFSEVVLYTSPCSKVHQITCSVLFAWVALTTLYMYTIATTVSAMGKFTLSLEISTLHQKCFYGLLSMTNSIN